MSPVTSVKSVELGDRLIVPQNMLLGVRASLAWIAAIESEVPELKEPFGVLRQAASGKSFTAVDYRAGMKSVQETWRLGGVVSRSWKRWQKLFPKLSDLVWFRL